MATATAEAPAHLESEPADTFIVTLDQELFALAELPARLPKVIAVRPMAKGLPERWADEGLRARDGARVRLPSLKVGRNRYCSAEGLAWFIERLNRLATAEAAAS